MTASLDTEAPDRSTADSPSILRQSLSLYAANALPLLLTSALLVLPGWALLGGMRALVIDAWSLPLPDGAAFSRAYLASVIQGDSSEWFSPPVQYGLVALRLVSIALASLVLTGMALDIRDDRDDGPWKAGGQALRRLPGFAILCAIPAAAVGGIVGLGYLAMYLLVDTESIGGGFVEDLPGFIMFFAALAMGFYAVVIPVVAYLFSRWIVALPSLVDGAHGPVDALRHSWNLTRGQPRPGFFLVLKILGLFALIWLPARFVSLGFFERDLPLAPYGAEILSEIPLGLPFAIMLPLLWIAATLYQAERHKGRI